MDHIHSLHQSYGGQLSDAPFNLNANLDVMQRSGRLPQMDWFVNFCLNQKLSPTAALFVLRYLGTLIDSKGQQWAMHATDADLLYQAQKAAVIAKDPVFRDILMPLSDVLAYYPLQMNGLDDFINDFQRLLAPETGLPREVREQPQRLALAQAIFQANFFKSTPIEHVELEEIRSLDLASFNQSCLAHISLLQFWHTHAECSPLFRIILFHDSDVQPRLIQLSKPIFQTFYHAACNGDIHRLKAMLRIPTLDVNAQLANEDKTTALYLACYYRQLEVIQLLLQDPRIDANLPNIVGTSPLMKACADGYLDAVKVLLDGHCVEVNKRHNSGSTAFLFACNHGHADIVQLLLKDPDIDINQVLNDGESPFYMACARYLQPQDHLTDEARGRFSTIVKALLQDYRTAIDRPTKQGISPFYLACQFGNVELMTRLREDPRTDINRKSIKGATALIVASNKGHTRIVEELLKDLRLQPAIEMNIGTNALMLACEKGQTEVVRLLLNDGRININRAQQSGSTALLSACCNNHQEIVKLLLRKDEINVNVQGDHLAAPFYEACLNNMDIEILKLFLKNEEINLEISPKDFFRILIKMQKQTLEFILAMTVRYPIIRALLSETVKKALKKGISAGCQALLNTFSAACRDEDKAVAEMRRLFEKFFVASPPEVFAFTVLLCDGYLKIPHAMNASEADIKSRRFLQIAARLPLELQMILANRLENLNDLISTPDTEMGLRRVVRVIRNMRAFQ